MAKIRAIPDVTQYVGLYPGLIHYHTGTIGGAARVLDVGGTLTPTQLYIDPWRADREALLSDWIAVGWDMVKASKAARRKASAAS